MTPSDSERIDVTRREKSATKRGYQLESDQNAQMLDILRVITEKQLQSDPNVTAKRNSVDDWLNNPANDTTPPPRVPKNTPRSETLGYVPPRTNLFDAVPAERHQSVCDVQSR